MKRQIVFFAKVIACVVAAALIFVFLLSILGLDIVPSAGAALCGAIGFTIAYMNDLKSEIEKLKRQIAELETATTGGAQC